MGFFDKILDTLGFGSAKAAAPEPKRSIWSRSSSNRRKATGTGEGGRCAGGEAGRGAEA
jgi:hypothetical protein